ncbi:MAG TPA: histidine--tRNA ligase [Kiritimatiellia bacterium]|nr:histidine--tRNA ligase [Kiritimatiellia bacterium]HRZ11893.1 histidine--tRNA ligase [Kiritimatiellia bacterium]HSA17301.1 histidine--tRNA ligase [Kiritimatiellia bacterium]
MTVPSFQPLQGMSDLASPEVHLWQEVEEAARRLLALYQVEEVRTPILEPTGLFVRSLGEGTDVVQKEMYTFEDRGGRSVSLRPEGTAGVIRYLAGLGPEAAGARLYYLGPMFRAERPQAGRRRQFHQLGVELIGPPGPAQDVEAIALQQHLLNAWGLKAARIEINSRGLPAEQAAVSEGLRKALEPHEPRLCDDCRRRLKANVLRVLDCKQEGCRAVAETLPAVTDFMGADSRAYLDEVRRLLDLLELPAVINPRLVRGLDYYQHTIWEIRHPALGAQDALAGGGRYRIEWEGAAIEGVGFAAGLERIVTAVQHDRPASAESARGKPATWIVSQGAKALEQNLVLAQLLRQRGIACGLALDGRSVKAQMRAANRSGAAFAVIRGELEMEKGLFVLKSMKDGAQEELELPALVERLLRASRAEGT